MLVLLLEKYIIILLGIAIPIEEQRLHQVGVVLKAKRGD